MRYSSDIVVIDLEATCPTEDRGDNTIERSNIIEIGAVRLHRNSLEIVDTFSELVRPDEYPVVPFITEMTGISPEMVADCETFAAVGQRFLDWYGSRNKAIIAAFGAYYDIPLLRRECRRFDLPFRAHIVGGALDIRALAMAWLANENRRTSGVSLQTITEKMKIAEGIRHHRAVDDARAAAAVMQMFHLGKTSI